MSADTSANIRLLARGRVIDFPRRPLVMGIVNINADSFSGDGDLDVERALAQARRMLAEGADIIDVGGESARTNRDAISEQEEIDRLCPFLDRFAREVACTVPWDAEVLQPPLLSVNTWRPSVARAALAIGGDLLNDIGGLPNETNARICAEVGVALVIMHTVGQPKVPHTHVGYTDILATLDEFFCEKIALATAAGLPREAIILDPGIDFAKQCADNLQIYREVERLQHFNQPILLPVSRKTVIGEVLQIPDPSQRDAGTVACIVRGILGGAHIFRVHNVQAAAQTIKTITALQT